MKAIVILNLFAVVSAGKFISISSSESDEVASLGADMDVEGQWRLWSASNSNAPINSVIAGFDNNGVSLVMRASHAGTMVIGKFFPMSRKAWISYGGTEHQKSTFELFTHNNYFWATKEHSRPLVPPVNGNYICRVNHDNVFWTPGKVDANMKQCVYGYNNKEISTTNFEVLRRMC